MRFHMTQDFSQARAAHTAAYCAMDEYDGEMEDAEYKRLSAAEYDALDDVMFADAVTPTEISEKVNHYASREMNLWRGGEKYLDKIKADLKHMQGHPVSPEFRKAWAVWRALEIEYDQAARQDDEAANRLTPNRDQLYVEIAMRSCTTPGDFILKQYLRMLTTLGGYDSRALRDQGTANRWDIDIGDGDGDARFERADNIGIYDDLNNCLTGMNLLAYGWPDFHPDAWIEAAERVGLEVYVVKGGTALCSYVGEDVEPVPERIRRERDRLRRIISADTIHVAMLVSEIEQNWPQLVVQPDQAPLAKAA